MHSHIQLLLYRGVEGSKQEKLLYLALPSTLRHIPRVNFDERILFSPTSRHNYIKYSSQIENKIFLKKLQFFNNLTRVSEKDQRSCLYIIQRKKLDR